MGLLSPGEFLSKMKEKRSNYIDYSQIKEEDFDVNIEVLDDQFKLLHFIYKKENINFKLSVRYNSTRVINIQLFKKFKWKMENEGKPIKLYFQLKYFCYNQFYKYISIIKKNHYFYKGLEYDVVKLYREHTKLSFKYQILQLRSKITGFGFYWKHTCRNWNNEFLKDNLWSRQIIIDFLCRFNKLKVLGKKKKWILDETKYFYLKGFKFKNESNNKTIIDNMFIVYNGRIGCKNETKEVVKFFNGEECLINYYNEIPFHINRKTILHIKNILSFKYYFVKSITSENTNLLKIMNINIKQIYQIVVSKNKLETNNKSIIRMIKIIYKNIDDEQIKYPKYLKKKIKFECQKILIKNF